MIQLCLPLRLGRAVNDVLCLGQLWPHHRARQAAVTVAVQLLTGEADARGTRHGKLAVLLAAHAAVHISATHICGKSAHANMCMPGAPTVRSKSPAKSDGFVDVEAAHIQVRKDCKQMLGCDHRQQRTSQPQRLQQHPPTAAQMPSIPAAATATGETATGAHPPWACPPAATGWRACSAGTAPHA